ncbi:MAG: hypothetical protein F4Y38_09350 [Gemmatimonadetes bacterium]|nr:hypothetical protein [Gemmatimonadota bacterium]MYG84809.1 hypothetical protein [Gemmatimonadota bacterium]MYJ90869.1 hypothetical protein [Gemmatimonadota bacterium]
MLRLPRTVYEGMAAHAVAEYPRECCGFLTGTGGLDSPDRPDDPTEPMDPVGQVESIDPESWRVHRCRNIQDELHAKDPAEHPRDARTAYAFSRADMERLFFGEFDPPGARVQGFYHSHPDAPAYFSEKDRMDALTGWLDPEPGYLVLSVTKDAVSDIKMFRWVDDETGFEELPVELV